MDGSQGAKKINDTLIELIHSKKNDDYQIMWATGMKNYDEIKKIFEEKGMLVNNLKNAIVVPYIYNMEEIMNVADLLVCRSGAITITEIAKLGKPSIFVPLPNVSNNHQEKNAKVLENIGGAFIISDSELNEENLNNTINLVITNPKKLEEMGKMAQKIDIKNVEEKIFGEITKLLQS